MTRARQKLHLARYPKHAYDDPNEVLPVPDDAWPRQWQAEHMLAISRLRPLTLSEEEKAEAVRTRLAAEEVCAD